MIGDILKNIREEHNLSKADLARLTGINAGHIAHIEKEERNPSHRALKTICRALEIPYQPLMYAYDKYFTEEQKLNNMPNHYSYNKVLAVSSLDSFIECPLDLPSAALAFKITDEAMMPKLLPGMYAFIEFNSPLESRDIGLFEYDGKLIVRRLVVRKIGMVLRADNKDFPELPLDENINYTIVGKVLGTDTGLIF